jgi:hypothetical protein
LISTLFVESFREGIAPRTTFLSFSRRKDLHFVLENLESVPPWSAELARK